MARGLSSVSPEWRVVLSGARTRFDPEALRRAPLPSARLDWDRVAEIAWQHRVAPLLYRALRDDGQLGVPKPVLELLERAYLATAARNSLLFRVLRDVLEALSAADVPVIALKGAVLADTIYRERALRPMNDIDLLIREQDLDRTQRGLGGIGYEMMHDAETRAELRRRHHHWVFRNPALSSIPLEPHWLLHPPGSPFRVDTAGLWQRSVPTRIAGIDALRLSPEDLLLHLCTHAARHRFNGGLIFLVDVAATTRHCENQIDWARLETRAEEWGADAHVSVVLRLAAELLGAPVPTATLETLQRMSPDGELYGLVRERLLEEKGRLRMAAELRLRWRRSGFREKTDVLRRVVWPTPATGNGSAKTPRTIRVAESLGRYIPLTWTLLRHPRAVTAIVRREARKARLDSWCATARE